MLAAPARGDAPGMHVVIFSNELQPLFIAAIARIDVDSGKGVSTHAVVQRRMFVEPFADKFGIGCGVFETMRRKA